MRSKSVRATGWRLLQTLLIGWMGVLLGGRLLHAEEIQSPEEKADSLRLEIEQNPNEPEAVVALYRLTNLAPVIQDREQKIYRVCEWASNTTHAELRVVALRCLWHRAYFRADYAETERILKSLGTVNRWMMIGPFDNEAGVAYEMAYPPEEEFDPKAEYLGKERSITWRRFPHISHVTGQQYFSSVLNPDRQAAVYLFGQVAVQEEKDVLLWLGAGGSLKIWLNGDLAASWEEYRAQRIFQSAYKIHLKSGVNTILVKVMTRDKDFSFSCFMTDPDGHPLADLDGAFDEPASDEKVPFPSSPMTWTLNSSVTPVPYPLAVDLLTARYSDAPAARTALNISRLHEEQRAFNPEKKLNEEFIEKALELSPSDPESLLWCREVVDNRNRGLECLEKGRSAHPDDPRFLLALAEVYFNEGMYTRAKSLVSSVIDDPRVHYAAVILMAHLKSRNGWPIEAMNLIESEFAKSPTLTLALELVSMYEINSKIQSAVALRENLLKQNPGWVDQLRYFTSHWLNRHNIELALNYSERVTKAAPYNISEYKRRSEILLGAKRIDEARAVLKTALSIKPDDPELIEELGDLENQYGSAEEAGKLYHRSLELRPQNSSLTEYIEFTEPKRERFELAYIRDPFSVIEANPEGALSKEGAEVLLESSVEKVFENGLSSRFRQVIIRVIDDVGVNEYNTFSIPFAPDRQQIKIFMARVIKPDGETIERSQEMDFSLSGDFRMYYDYKARIVHFPDLKPHDVVELQYRVDDSGRNNLFADYFGTLESFVQAFPVKERQIVVLFPEKRQIYYNHPTLAPEPVVVSKENGTREYVWTARDIPKLKAEPRMPPVVEVTPVLHISTFKDWEAMGAWYWGLAKDQLVPKESLRRKVHEVIDGATDNRDRMERIYSWVIKNTRYVALEFGVHSYKPYPVNQVFDRKFGDCKDKASLLVAMLKEAGIAAHLAIVRTRNIGIMETYPPSLSMFNHAIAYVPEFDLYLDGTSEHGGAYELPWQDQGAQVMLILDGATRFTTIPISRPEENLMFQDNVVTILADGSARVEQYWEIRGQRAASWRTILSEIDKRKDVFEMIVNRSNPGAKIDGFTVSDVTDLSIPVKVRILITIPNIGRAEGKKLFLPQTFFLLDPAKDFASLSKREHPLWIEFPQFYFSRIVYRFEGRSLGPLPIETKVSEPFGQFETSLEAGANEITVVMSFGIFQTVVPVSGYDAFSKFCQSASRAIRQEIQVSHD